MEKKMKGDFMPTLTYDQVNYLNSFSIYTEDPDKPLFTLANIQKDFYVTKDFLNLLMGITNAATEAAAVSHFGRRFGTFIATQFYLLTKYDEIWDGKDQDLRFAYSYEYGVHTFSMHITPNDFRYVKDEERERVITNILYKVNTIITQLRKTTSISPLILWENIFGYMLYNFHVLLDDPTVSDRAFEDLEYLESPDPWRYFSNKSLFYNYTNGAHPSKLIQTEVRKSCCFSKDIPGLQECGFCPMRKK